MSAELTRDPISCEMKTYLMLMLRTVMQDHNCSGDCFREISGRPYFLVGLQLITTLAYTGLLFCTQKRWLTVRHHLKTEKREEQR